MRGAVGVICVARVFDIDVRHPSNIRIVIPKYQKSEGAYSKAHSNLYIPSLLLFYVPKIRVRHR